MIFYSNTPCSIFNQLLVSLLPMEFLDPGLKPQPRVWSSPDPNRGLYSLNKHNETQTFISYFCSDAYPEALKIFGVLMAGIILGIVLYAMRQRSRRKLRLALIRGKLRSLPKETGGIVIYITNTVAHRNFLDLSSFNSY